MRPILALASMVLWLTATTLPPQFSLQCGAGRSPGWCWCPEDFKFNSTKQYCEKR